MKEFSLIFISLFFTLSAVSQSFLPDFSYQNFFCSDLGRNIDVLNNWEIYQTTNGQWNGPVTGACFEYVKPHTSGIGKIDILLSAIDTSLPVFIRAKFNSPVPLDENSLYMAHSVPTANRNIFQTGNNCNGGICSGMILLIQIPDSSGNSITQREHLIPADVSNNYVPIGLLAQSCVPTENFTSGNFLSEFVQKIEITSSLPSDSISVNPYSFSFEKLDAMWGNVQFIRDSVAFPASSGRTHHVSTDYITGGWGSANFLVLFSDSGYPSASNFSNVEFIPNPNPATVDTIVFVVEQNNFLTFQPYTNIVGAHPYGDTTNRHIVHLINNGAEMCFYAIVEKVFENGDRYIHRSGSVNFNSPQSCFAFGKGGVLEVADGAVFHYGGKGKGMMALRTGGKIVIGKRSELIIHGHINMFEYGNDPEPQQIFMSLNKGSRLTFAEGSRLTNMFSKDNTIKLNVYMNGGILDDSDLPYSDRSLINRIYTDRNYEYEDALRVLENPVNHFLKFNYVPRHNNENIKIEIITLDGKNVLTHYESVQTGSNKISLFLSMSPGVYFMKISAPDRNFLKKIVKV